ncbi:MAG: 50S ribosomal protein L13 [Candidatus Tectomicrobia bacterium]|uniref:Large ribosomal subunit protein uL13 n=1 Tax=Tectimicrobiota bacterium TaxID=2528274 RepID=A0A932GRK9_UNCTE|nr:50S ribosomal protein L13 [Candidatus Tectomicrobia bacterium]
MRGTLTPNLAEIAKKWYLVDARGKVLGRLASEVARILRGKNKPAFTPHLDTGDHVIVVNAAQVVLTGKKLQDKKYIRHSRYPGGLHSESAAEVLAAKPERIIENAVRGMLPKNRLGRQLIGKLKVYPAAEHPHQAQKPETVEL